MAALSLLVLVFVVGCGAAGSSSSPVKIAGPPPGSSSGLHGVPVNRPVEPDVTLTDTHGRPFNLIRGTRGKLTLVYVGYTHCPDVCPTTMADLAGALRKLTAPDRARIAVVFITSDPWRDTPKVIRSWLASFDASFTGLTGDYGKIRAAARSMGIALQRPATTTGDYEVTHGAEVIAFGTDHRAHVIYTAGVSIQDYAADLPKLLRSAAPVATQPGGAGS